MSADKKLFEMETFFLALADKTRLRILNLMRDEEICVGSLVEVLNESQPKISRHLAYMRSAGVVETRRDGKWIYYKISQASDDFTADILRKTLEWLNSQENMRDEFEKLISISETKDETLKENQALQFQTSANTDMNKKQKKELETFLL